MKKLSIATAGAGVLALSVFGASSAEAASLTKLDYSGSVSVSSPLLFLLEPTSGGLLDVPIETSIVVDDLDNRLSDGELTIPIFSSLEDYFSISLSDYLSLDVFEGIGSVFSDAAKSIQLSTFDWFYDSSVDILTIGGYDFDSLSSCLVGTCYLAGDGEATATLPLIGEIEAFFDFDLTQTATLLSSNGADSLPGPPPDHGNYFPGMSSGTTDDGGVVTSYPDSQAVPEPAALLGLFGLAGFLAAKRRQEKVA